MKPEQCLGYSLSKRLIAYLLLFFQLFLPLSAAFSGIAHAVQSETPISSTMDGLNALMSDASTELASPPSLAPTMEPFSPSPLLSKDANEGDTNVDFGLKPQQLNDDNNVKQDDLFSASPLPALSSDFINESAVYFDLGFKPQHLNNDNIVKQDDILRALPTLGLPDAPETSEKSPEMLAAESASKAGQILSSENAVDISINYARSLGENLVNQQINDWLGQFGKARINLSSNKQIDADFLLPLIDLSNQIFFAQAGVRTTDERNITNLGAGFRQYQDGWMWGINSFYDYDITGRNSRVGIGSELWMDYFKLAGNGYFRLTDWHQSKLHEMRDYDERPANGFDIRAEGYLPSYPQLGAFAKYEQYFGNDISLSSSTSVGDLKNNPSKSTLGVSYTPFPLMTLKGETSRGDSTDSKVGMELTYRLGVPLSRQMNPDNVDLMRSLVGNRYDFVDRNYDIVMQYRKQELISISLPKNLNAKAAEVVPVSVTVNKAKYGLKSIDWAAPELIANGGSIRTTSPTTIDLTLPAYVFETRENKPQQYRLSAMAKDNEDNLSNTAVMWINVNPSGDNITELQISPNRELLANNRDTYTVVAVVKSDKGEALENKEIIFTVADFRDNSGVTLISPQIQQNSRQSALSVTDAQGLASVIVSSKIAGKGRLIATMRNGNSRASTLLFKADSSTAKIQRLDLIQDKAVANGSAYNVAKATVLDQFDNPVEDFALNATATNGATVITPAQLTNDLGQITTEFTNITSGKSTLEITGTGTQKAIDSVFISDISTATIKSVTISDNGAVANGVDTNTVVVTVVDGNGNILANAPVSIQVPNTAQYKTNPANGVTNEQGQLTVNITNTKAGQASDYHFEINGNTQMAELNFIADKSTAKVSAVILDGSEVTQVADGKNAFTYSVTVTDAKGNPVNGVAIEASKDKEGVSIATSGVTEGEGQAHITLTSSLKAVSQIIVSAQVGSTNPERANQMVSFTADSDKSRVLAVTLVDPVTESAENSKVANGKNTFTFKAEVKDSETNGNPVANMVVDWQITPSDAAVTFPASTETDEQGFAYLTVTSTTKTTPQIKVSAASTVGGYQSVAQKDTVSFIADKENTKPLMVTLVGDVTEKVANGTNTFEFKAKLEDINGNPIPNQPIVWGKSNGPSILIPLSMTNGDGISEIKLQSIGTVAELDIIVNASYLDLAPVNANKHVSFIADVTTAKVSKIALVDSNVTTKIANGRDVFEYTVTVVDEHNNLLPGIQVQAGVAEPIGTRLTVNSGNKTDVNGNTVITLNATTTAMSDIFVQAQAGTREPLKASQSVNFVANKEDAKIGFFELDAHEPTEKIANGSNTFTYKVKVVDSFDNPLKGEIVIVDSTLPNSLKNNIIIAIPDATDAEGFAKVILSSTKVAVSNIMLKAHVGGGESQEANKTVSFIADIDNATIRLNASSKPTYAGVLLPVEIITVDGNDNPIGVEVDLLSTPNTDVTFYNDKDKTLLDKANSITTSSKGKATIYVTSTKAQQIEVKGTLVANSQSDKVDLTFIADKESAYVADLKPKSVEISEQVAGVDIVPLTATVLDQYGNIVDGVMVLYSTQVGGFGSENKPSLGVDSDNLGKAQTTLSSLKSGVATVVAKVGAAGKPQIVDVTFIANNATAAVVELHSDRAIASVGTMVDLTALVKDKNGNLVTNRHKVTLSISNLNEAIFANNAQTIELVTNDKGIVETTITSLVSGIANVLANTAENLEGEQVDVQFAPRSDTARVSTLRVNKPEVFAGVMSFNAGAIFTAEIVDDHGNLVPDSEVVFTVSQLDGAGFVDTELTGENALLTTITVQSNDKGIATAVLKSKKSGNATVHASTIKSPTIKKPMSVSFTGDPASAVFFKLEATSVNNPPVAGVDEVIITGVVQDKNGNPVKETTVDFSSERGLIKNSPVKTDGQGNVSTILTSDKAELINYKAVITNSLHIGSGDIDFIGNKKTAAIVKKSFKATPEQPIAGAMDKPSILSAKVTDEKGNPLEGIEVIFTTDIGEFEKTLGKRQITVATTADGLATTTLTSNNMGVGNLTAKIANQTAEKASVEFISGANTPYVSSLINTTSTQKVGERAQLIVSTSTKVGQSNKPVGNVSVNFSASAQETQFYASASSNGVIESITTGSDGTASVYVMTTRKGDNQITASSSGVDVNNVIIMNVQGNSELMKITELVLTPENGVAGGDDKISAVATVSDGYGNLFEGVDVTFTTTLGQFGNDKPQDVKATKIESDGKSKATTELTSQKSGPARVTATLANGSSMTQSANFTIASVESLKAKPKTNVVVGTASTLTAKIVDMNGNPLKGVLVAFVSSAGQLNDSGEKLIKVSSQEDGTASAVLTHTLVGDVTVTATTGSDAVGKVETVTFVADSQSAHVTLLSNGDITSITAGKPMTLTMTTADQYGNTIGTTVNLSATNNSGVTFFKDKEVTKPLDANNSVIVDSSGSAVVYAVAKTATTTKPVTITATSPYKDLDVNNTVKFHVIADIDSAKVLEGSVRLQDEDVIKRVANGKDAFQYSASLADQFKNPIRIPDLEIQWTSNNTDVVFGPTDVSKTNADGNAFISLTSKIVASNVLVSAQYNATPKVAANTQVHFVTDIETAHVSEVTTPNTTATVGQRLAVNITTTDSSGNPVSTPVQLESKPSKTVTFYPSATGGTALSNNSVTTGENGKATVYVTSLTVQDIIIMAKTATATPDENNSSDPLSFTADSTTAHVVNLLLTPTSQKVGKLVAVTVTTQDAHTNAVGSAVTLSSAEEVIFYQDAAGTKVLPKNVIETGIDGKGTAYVTSLIAQEITVLASSVNPSKDINNSKNARFTLDSTTARVVELGLTPTSETVGKFVKVTMTTQDSYANPISATVTLSSKDGITFYQDAAGTIILPKNVIETDADGKATAYVTSLKAQKITVLASSTNTSEDKNNRKDATFIADKTTVRVRDLALTPETEIVGKLIAAQVATVDMYANAVGGLVTLSSANEKVIFYQDDKGITVLKDNKVEIDGTGKVTVYVTSLAAQEIAVSANSINIDNDTNNNKKAMFTLSDANARVVDVALAPETETVGKMVAVNILTQDEYANAGGTRVTLSSKNERVTFYEDNQGQTALQYNAINTGTDGKATVYVTSLKAQEITVLASSSNASEDRNNSKKALFTADSKSLYVVDMGLAPETAFVGELIAVNISTEDKYGNVASGPVTLSSPQETVTFYQDKAGTALKDNTIVTGTTGKATAYVTSQQAQKITVLASSINTSEDKNNKKQATFNQDLSTAHVLRLEAKSKLSTVGELLPLSIVTVDGYNGAISTEVTLTSMPNNRVTFYRDDKGSSVLTNNRVQTNGKGEATVYVTSTLAQVLTVTARTETVVEDLNNQVKLTFVAGEVDISNSMITVDKTKYAMNGMIVTTVSLTDKYGNRILGRNSDFESGIIQVTVPNSTVISSQGWVEQPEAGNYRRQYQASKLGENLKATLALAGHEATQSSAPYKIEVTFSGQTDVKGSLPSITSDGIYFYPSWVEIEFIPELGYEFDSKCLTISGSIDLSNYTYVGKYPINSWGRTNMSGSEGGHSGYKHLLKVTNACGIPVKGTVKLRYVRPPNAEGSIGTSPYSEQYIQLESY